MSTSNPNQRKSVLFPSSVTLALALIAGVLAVLNQTAFNFGRPWSSLITYGLLLLTSLGISPLIGDKFRAALHLSAKLSLAITTVAFVAATFVVKIDDQTTKGILLGVLTFLSGIGFGPANPAVLAAHPEQQNLTGRTAL